MLDLEDHFPTFNISPIVRTPAPVNEISLPTVTSHSERTDTVTVSQSSCQPLDGPAGRRKVLSRKPRKDKKMSVRLSIKTDLIAAEMGEVSKVLILDDAASFLSCF